MNSVPEQKPPYLFYSPKCGNCAQLFELLKKNQQLYRAVIPVNIHTTKNLPQGLEGVPAILFRGQLLIGADAFKWIQMQTPQQDQRQQPVQLGQKEPQMQQQKSQDWDVLDICGSNTACYSMLEEAQNKGEKLTSNTIQKFAFLDQPGSDKGVDMIAAMSTGENNKRSNGMAQQLEQLQKMRGEDVKGNGLTGPGANYGYQQGGN